MNIMKFFRKISHGFHSQVLVFVYIILQASKGAVIRFYETLRAELGSHVRVTILMPGYVVSNLTKGKGLQKDGHVGIDEEARDVSSISSSSSILLSSYSDKMAGRP